MSNYHEEETLPPRLPWILLCHSSGAMCGNVFTVNRLPDWGDVVKARREHEQKCFVSPKLPHQVNPNV